MVVPRCSSEKEGVQSLKDILGGHSVNELDTISIDTLRKMSKDFAQDSVGGLDAAVD